MNISDLLAQGVELMMLGMGIVFFILGLLVFTLKFVSSLILKSEPQLESQTSEVTSTRIDEDIIAAISIAIERHRS